MDRDSTMTAPEPSELERAARQSATKWCGPACPYRDWLNGLCERHGPTIEDEIVDRVASNFRRNLDHIMKGMSDEAG